MREGALLDNRFQRGPGDDGPDSSVLAIGVEPVRPALIERDLDVLDLLAVLNGPRDVESVGEAQLALEALNRLPMDGDRRNADAK